MLGPITKIDNRNIYLVNSTQQRLYQTSLKHDPFRYKLIYNATVMYNLSAIRNLAAEIRGL
jgi:hypothetical protein